MMLRMFSGGETAPFANPFDDLTRQGFEHTCDCLSLWRCEFLLREYILDPLILLAIVETCLDPEFLQGTLDKKRLCQESGETHISGRLQVNLFKARR